jgi:tetratricopeptide (TPR) repeat protein
MRLSFTCLIPALLLIQLNAFPQNNQDTPGQEALRNYRTGRDLESRNRMNEAEYYYNEAVKICNNEISRNIASQDTYTTLVWTLQRQRKYADVISWGERGLRLFADEYRILEIMGEAYFYLDNHELSMRFMQRYLNYMPRGERASVAYFFIGEIFRYRSKFFHADIAYSTAVRLEPNVALWWYRLGTVREAAEDYVQAIAAYGNALRLNTYYPEATEAYARCRRKSPINDG